MPPSDSPGAGAPHLLIPFASHRGVACRAALSELDLPHLEALLGRLAVTQEDRQDESTLNPPHERALAQALGLQAPDGLLPWAALEARRLGLSNADGDGDEAGDGEAWGLVTLCHWQVGLSEVVLGDPALLGITAAESAALLQAIRPYFDEDGLALHAAGQPGRWLAQGAALQGLPTAAIDRATGQPLDAWLPMGEGARALRRLQNEMQMLLYTTRVNDERTARGMAPINSFWLSGTGHAPAALPTAPAPQILAQLREPALQDDGASWAQCWRELDSGALADLLRQAEGGAPVRLTLCGDRAALQLDPRPRGIGGWLRSRLRRTPASDVLERL